MAMFASVSTYCMMSVSLEVPATCNKQGDRQPSEGRETQGTLKMLQFCCLVTTAQHHRDGS